MELERLSAALIAGGAGTFRWDIKRDVLEWDDSLRRLFGRPAGEEVRSLADFLATVHPEDRQDVKSACGHCAAEGIDFNMEFRVVWPDGSVHWLSDRGQTIVDEEGRPSYLVGACVDVTKRRRYEGQLRDQRDVLRSIVAGAPLEEILENLTLAVERRAERPVIASILLCSAEGKLVSTAGRRLPAGWTKLIENLEIGPKMGSCGTAAHQGERVIVSDIQSDPRWACLKEEAAAFGLEACWSTPIFSSSGNVLGTFAIYHPKPTIPTEWELHLVDVLTGTAAVAIERERAEEALRAANAAVKEQAKELQEVSDAVPALIAFVDRDRRFQFCNRTFSFWSRKPSEEILGKQIWEIVRPEIWREIEPRIESALEGKTVEFELASQGTEEGPWVHVVYTPRRDRLGNILGVIIFAKDITARKAAEAALRASEIRFRTMADTIAQFAWMADAQGSIFWYNQRWFDYTGTTLEEMRGWGWTKVQHPDHVERVVRRIQRSWETGEPWEDTFPLRAKDGSYRWFLSRALAIRDKEGKVLCWFGTNTDITEQRATAEELARIRLELERLNNELEETVNQRTQRLRETVEELESFSYSIAHDMRAPLRSLQGFSRILLDDYGKLLDEAGRSYLENIAGSADRMDRMVRDILNYSKTAREELPLEAVDSGRLLREIIYSYPDLSPEKVDMVMEGEFPEVLGNAAALTQCFSNLLGNAVKFVPPGTKPAVRIRAEDLGSEVRISITDNGIGIAPDQQERIFDLFQQVSKSYGGTGVGLAIVRKAVARMGGRLGVDSTPGKGSRFWIEIRKAAGQK